MRQCSKPGCSRTAVATLTYVYKDSTAVLGPLSTVSDPHAFELCDHHAESLTVPRGWEVIRLQTQFEPAPPSADDLHALVEVIREVAGKPESDGFGRSGGVETSGSSSATHSVQESPEAKYAPLRRRDHFTVVEGISDGALNPSNEPEDREPTRGVFGPDK